MVYIEIILLVILVVLKIYELKLDRTIKDQSKELFKHHKKQLEDDRIEGLEKVSVEDNKNYATSINDVNINITDVSSFITEPLEAETTTDRDVNSYFKDPAREFSGELNKTTNISSTINNFYND